MPDPSPEPTPGMTPGMPPPSPMARDPFPAGDPVPADVVLAAAPVAILVTDLAGRVTGWNPGAERILGIRAADAIGELPPPAVYGDDPEARESLLRRIATREPVTDVVTSRDPDGRRLDLLATFAPLADERGHPAGTVAVLHDATAQQGRERALRARAGLVERLHEVVVGLNAHAELPDILRGITDACVDLLSARAAGYALLEDGWLRIAAFSGSFADAERSRLPYEGSVLHELMTGAASALAVPIDRIPRTAAYLRERVPDCRVLAVARTQLEGTPTGGLYAFFPDRGRDVCRNELSILTQLADYAGAAIANARAYGDVVRAQERERAIVDAMADGMAVVDDRATVLEWNPAAAAMTGLAADEVLGGPLPFPLPPADASRPLDHELPSGRWIEILVTPIAGTDERVVDFRDITEPKRLEEAKDLFLATTGHELRTPITVMKGFSETLLHHWDAMSDANRKTGVEVIVHRTEALAGLVEQLLLGSRIEEGATTLTPTAFDIAAALRISLAAFERFSARHRVTLEVAGDMPEVLADRIAFDNVVGQLLENAIKYSPEGGEVRVGARADGDAVVLTVADEGIGIAPEHAERVFERFYQADAGNRRRFGGVGLGLYIVRLLVEAQGGRVRVLPRERGACLEVRLPAVGYPD